MEAVAPASAPVATIAGALQTFLAARRKGDYLALLAYIARDAANVADLEALRLRLMQQLGIPVLLGYGPRYLHSIGQLYKGGPASGLFVIMSSRKAEELPIPGASYTFAQLQMAQALGDMQRLGLHNRPAIRLHLTQGASAGLVALRGIVDRTFAAQND